MRKQIPHDNTPLPRREPVERRISPSQAPHHLGLAGKIASQFVNSKLTPLIIITALLLGGFAILKTPREEEPQIRVPMMDVTVQFPGATAKEVEQRITNPIEHLVHEVPGVEYIYSISNPGQALVIVRFYVGQDPNQSIVALKQKLDGGLDRLPPGASLPVVKLRSIDDVPIMAFTLHSKSVGYLALRQLALRAADSIREVNDVSEVKVIGGEKKEVRVTLNKEKLAGYSLTPQTILQTLKAADSRYQAGDFNSNNTQTLVRSGGFLENADDVGNLVVGSSGNKPIFLHDVAKIEEGAEEPKDYTLFGYGPNAHKKGYAGLEDAVTISVAKLPGINAVTLAHNLIRKVDSLKGTLLPDNVTVTITRDYGHTANEKAGDLLYHMAIAVISVTLLIALILGRRESMVVAIAIPVTLALTLVVFYLYGYTLNRITLFALIFSIGILVDDAIVVVENIVRHYRMPLPERRPPLEAVIYAVDEVGNPTILATFTVIAAILPMAFVGGLMGPYMRPIPVGSSAAMLFSLGIAFTVTPWAAYRLLHKETPSALPHSHGETHGHDWTARIYRKVMTPLLQSGRTRLALFTGVIVLLLGSIYLIYNESVVVKMLPFDNKDEFQLIVDMPNGTTLDQTAAATRELADYIARVPEVNNFQVYVGTASPYNFNGLVRHYYMRDQPYQADIQVNLAGKSERSAQSHTIVKRIRPALAEIARKWGIRLKVAEVPPGPPVQETLVAEIYGPTNVQRLDLAGDVKRIFHTTPGVVDTDWDVDDAQPTYRIAVDREKAALDGVSVDSVNNTLAIALSGESAGLAHDPEAREPIPIRLRLSRADRSGINKLQSLYVTSNTGKMVPLSELTHVDTLPMDGAIYHKNMLPVIYVTGDVAGRLESPVYAIIAMNRQLEKLHLPTGESFNVLSTRLPFTQNHLTLKWDGEWQITYEVFRDLGVAFAVVLVLIYVLVVGWYQSFKTPLVIMAPIPLTLIGILPAHAMMHAFFTATSMIGFIAGAGIIIRNSIILVDFIELRLKQGLPLEEAVIEAGATRFRPMLLTALAVIVGSSVILTDPIFQGLAISLMAGEVASTFLSLPAVPILYFLIRRKERGIEQYLPSGHEPHASHEPHMPVEDSTT